MKDLNTKTKVLLAKAGFDAPFEIQPLDGGANNRVFRVALRDGTGLLLKAYFQHPDDKRDRLNAEFSFARFAWDSGVRALPEPFVRDDENRLALYRFVEGSRLKPGQVTEGCVRQALDFFLAVNECKNMPDARLLPPASEACFSLGEHIHLVGLRVNRLLNIDDSTPANSRAARFVRSELLASWTRIVDEAGQTAAQQLSFEEQITSQDSCISPSDFGFHNALLPADGNLIFIDFEYAGWDDPAKLVCDFFCQPAVPVPFDFYDLFAKTVAAETSRPDYHLKRFALLLPVYQIKWCCILLNDFLPTDSKRRRFAHGAADCEQRKEHQLHKASEALKGLTRRTAAVLVRS